MDNNTIIKEIRSLTKDYKKKDLEKLDHIELMELHEFITANNNGCADDDHFTNSVDSISE